MFRLTSLISGLSGGLLAASMSLAQTNLTAETAALVSVPGNTTPRSEAKAKRNRPRCHGFATWRQRQTVKTPLTRRQVGGFLASKFYF